MEAIAQLYGIADTGKALGIGRTSVYGLLDSGDLTPIKIGRRTLVAASEISEYIEDRLTALRAAPVLKAAPVAGVQ